jgi:murein DD-endopeptidase MepM/ murein hydrolase activator NlpD
VTVVDHGAGLATVYAHQAGFMVRTGTPVEAGQAIGYVGETGRSFGPHLHFEVRIHGTPVDPLVYLPASTTPLSSGEAFEMSRVATP